MYVYPAIDLYEGQVVRLSRGDYNQKKVYSDDPKFFAKQWEEQGAKWLHIIDLEGAKAGSLKNHGKLLEIRDYVSCNIQFGGGLRNINDIGTIINAGVQRVILGTKALDESFLKDALDHFGTKIAVGLDIRDGVVQTEGWLEDGEETLESAIEMLNQLSVATIIYTDIHKDGMLEGPNFDKLKEVLAQSKSQVILSGGVSSITDIQKCAELTEENFEGVITGKALYENKFTVHDAVEIGKKSREK